MLVYFRCIHEIIICFPFHRKSAFNQEHAIKYKHVTLWAFYLYENAIMLFR